MGNTDLQGAKILVVDDTSANLDVLCDLLEGRGYDILMAPSGSIALKIAVKALPDLILLDVWRTVACCFGMGLAIYMSRAGVPFSCIAGSQFSISLLAPFQWVFQ